MEQAVELALPAMTLDGASEDEVALLHSVRQEVMTSAYRGYI